MRDLEEELLCIIEAAVTPARFLKPSKIYAKAKALGLSSDKSSVEIIRADRDRDEHRFDD